MPALAPRYITRSPPGEPPRARNAPKAVEIPSVASSTLLLLPHANRSGVAASILISVTPSLSDGALESWQHTLTPRKEQRNHSRDDHQARSATLQAPSTVSAVRFCRPPPRVVIESVDDPNALHRISLRAKRRSAHQRLQGYGTVAGVRSSRAPPPKLAHAHRRRR